VTNIPILTFLTNYRNEYSTFVIRLVWPKKCKSRTKLTRRDQANESSLSLRKCSYIIKYSI